MAAKKKVHIWRLLWVIFIFVYCVVFFHNMFRPQHNWHLIYIYTLLLIAWFCLEYYERHLFFQTGLLTHFSWLLRTAFALFFYSSFIIGIATVVWWHGNSIGLYPYTQIIGIGCLIYAVVVRRQIYRRTVIKKKFISRFYTSLFFLTLSVALAYGSLFLLFYVVFIGLPLIVFMRKYEIAGFAAFLDYVQKTGKTDKITAKNYHDLWAQYLSATAVKPSHKQ